MFRTTFDGYISKINYSKAENDNIWSILPPNQSLSLKDNGCKQFWWRHRYYDHMSSMSTASCKWHVLRVGHVPHVWPHARVSSEANCIFTMGLMRNHIFATSLPRTPCVSESGECMFVSALERIFALAFQSPTPWSATSYWEVVVWFFCVIVTILVHYFYTTPQIRIDDQRYLHQYLNPPQGPKCRFLLV